ncbi:MAG: glutathione S-transferase family protein [Pseudomonadales bacterium]|nr:glutathione S-transferase family protein [Pseudomonadales bacterium]MDG1443493.1 glutathione S-transferase family protein [Pseudomonadales bacterium]
MARVENPKSPIVAKMKGVHLFHYEGAPCAQRVRFALHEKGLMRGREERFDDDSIASCQAQEGAWVSRHVSLVKKDHMTKEYSLIQPNLVVPALVHDGQLHIESMEIIEYLDEAFGGTSLVPNQDTELLADAQALTDLGKTLHRSIRFVTFRWGLRGLARLSSKEENNLRELLKDSADGELLANFYEGYDTKTIPDSVYTDHLDKLNAAFASHEKRLQDGRKFLSGDDLTMADIIWAMKTLRLTECDYPFEQCYPAYVAWFKRVSTRPSFQEGVIGKHKFMSTAFRAKASVENLLGIGLKREVLKRVA